VNYAKGYKNDARINGSDMTGFACHNSKSISCHDKLPGLYIYAEVGVGHSIPALAGSLGAIPI
jgi:hypothetical protein